MRAAGWNRDPDQIAQDQSDPLPRVLEARWRLYEALVDGDADVRLAAVKALEELGPDASRAPRKLASALSQEKETRVRREMVSALSRLANGVASGDVVDALAGALADADDEVRRSAAAALVPYAQEHAKEVTAALAAAVKSPNGPRLAALQALAAIGPPAKDATREVIGAMEDADATVRAAAATALGRFGTPGEAARAWLRKALDDPDPAVRVAAAEALLAGKR
jgi:HEAT repeat protein